MKPHLHLRCVVSRNGVTIGYRVYAWIRGGLSFCGFIWNDARPCLSTRVKEAT